MARGAARLKAILRAGLGLKFSKRGIARSKAGTPARKFLANFVVSA